MAINDVIDALERGELPPPVSVTPPPADTTGTPRPRTYAEPPQIHVEPQPWQRPSWPTAAAPVTRAGADIHMRSATAMAVCGADETPMASVADPSMVTCRACRLMISAPHISPCSTERWLRDTPAPEPEPVAVVDAPRRGGRLGTAATIASIGVVGAAVILAAVAFVALSGHGGPSSSTGTGATPALLTGGGTAEPTAFATALPTEAPSAAPTAAPTATPAPTPGPAVQNQNVTVIDTNGQSQQQSQAQAQASANANATADPPAGPPAATSITFVNDAGRVVDLYWVNGGHEVSYGQLDPSMQELMHTYVGQTWVVRTDPCCVGGGGNVELTQVTATAAPQTVSVTAS